MSDAIIKISVLILTKNEEKDLPACLKSLNNFDDIHVYDAYSTDDTELIARAHGANFHRNDEFDKSIPFGGDEARYRNWALDNIKYKYEWLFVLDADERVSPGLVSYFHEHVDSLSGPAAYSIRRRDYFLDTWLKRVQASPYFVRLFIPSKVRYARSINSYLNVDGSIASIDGYIDHYPFGKGLGHWLIRHVHYSHFEAQNVLSNDVNFGRSLFDLFSSDFHKRRRVQKSIYYKLPFRPFLKFMWMYFCKFGFLDGRAGFIYSILISHYEYHIVLRSKYFPQE